MDRGTRHSSLRVRWCSWMLGNPTGVAVRRLIHLFGLKTTLPVAAAMSDDSNAMSRMDGIVANTSRGKWFSNLGPSIPGGTQRHLSSRNPAEKRFLIRGAVHIPRLLIATILLAAATLKLQALRQEIALQGMGVSTSATFLLIQWELFLATWLLFSRWSRTLWWSVFATFLIFFAYAIWAMIQGAASCGCMGELKIAPLWMAAMDAVILTSLLAMRRSFPEPRSHNRRNTLIPRSAVAMQLCAFLSASVFVAAPVTVQHASPGVTRVGHDVEYWEPEK